MYRTVLLLAFFTCLADSSLHAQTGSGYDRDAAVLVFPPAPGGGASTRALVRILARSGMAAGDDASTVAELQVNGTTVAVRTWDVSLADGGDPGACALDCGSSGCGGMYVDGVFNTMTCHDLGNDCACGHWFAWDPGYEPIPGDELMILLRPAPGALPDPDPTNDAHVRVFDGSTSGWNRWIEAVEVQDQGDGTTTVSLDPRLVLSNVGDTGAPSFDLSFAVEMYDSNGRTVQTEIVSMSLSGDILLGGGCNATCPDEVCGSIDAFPHFVVDATCMSPPQWEGNCGCGGGGTILIPDIPTPPGGIAKVVLKPVPGALPELPGFEEDDERRPDPTTGAPDRLGGRVLQLTGAPNPFNPSTTLSFELSVAGHAELTVYDVRGQYVATLHAGDLRAGGHRFDWTGLDAQGRAVASGVYRALLTVDGVTAVRQLALVK